MADKFLIKDLGSMPLKDIGEVHLAFNEMRAAIIKAQLHFVRAIAAEGQDFDQENYKAGLRFFLYEFDGSLEKVKELLRP